MTPHIESTDLDPLMQGEAPPPELPQSPQARVDASRAALQLWILRTYHPERLQPAPEDLAAEHRPFEADDPAWLGVVVDALNEVPGVAIGTRYLRRWWRRHPLYATFHMADEAGRDMLRPVAQRHPWLLLGGATVLGVVIGRARPWRWVSHRTLLAGLIPPISLASVLATSTAMFGSAPPHGAPNDADADAHATQGGVGAPPSAHAPSPSPTQSQSQSQHPSTSHATAATPYAPPGDGGRGTHAPASPATAPSDDPAPSARAA